VNEARINYSQADRAWFDAQVPDSPVKAEAIKVIAHLNEALAEPIRARPTLEVALVDAMEAEVKQAKATANYWRDKAIAEYNSLQAAERKVRKLVRQVQVWSSIALAGVIALGLFAWIHWGTR
jgi:hypothetical protein